MKKTLRALLFRVRSVFHRERLDREMREEMEYHLAKSAAERMATGDSSTDAHHAAQRRFGGMEQIRERCRDERGFVWVDQLVQDVRYATRALRRSPGFATVAILTLALGIGANTAIFTAVYSVLWRPLPYAEPGQLFSSEVNVPGRAGTLPGRIQDYHEWREADTVFSSVAAVRPATWILTGSDEPERLGGARVSTNFFRFLGVPIARGRGFSSDEERPGHDRVVILSDALWRRRFASDLGVIGRTITLDGEVTTIIGIAPASLLVPTGTLLHPMITFASRVDLWRPIAPTASELQGESWNHGILVRLKSGASLEQGRQQLQAMVNASVRRAVPDLKIELGVQLIPVRNLFSGKVRERLWLIFAASALLLAIACTNVANLLLSRAAGRSTELATRVALGAGRARIMRQMVVETLLLALLGAAAGVGMAWAGATWLVTQAPAEVRLLTPARPDLAVLLFGFAVALVATFSCAAFPAWQIFRRDIAGMLREDGRSRIAGRRGGVIRQILTGVQMALGTGLILVAALLLQSFVNVLRADRGYDVERVLALDLIVAGQRYNTMEKRAGFFRGVIERTSGLPGVQAAGGITDLPATGNAGTSQAIFRPEDADATIVLQRPVAVIHAVGGAYFSASGTVLRAGRFLREHEETPSAVVSESLVRRLWPQEPLTAVLGRGFRQGDVTGPVISLVGVVADARAGAVEREPSPQIYRPYTQHSHGRMTLVLRTSLEPTLLGRAVRADLRREDPNLPLGEIRTMREIVSAAVVARRFQLELITLFAVVALALGMVGTYGVVSYAVACRTREIGVRLALGATPRDVLRLASAVGLKPVAVGLSAGVVLALGAAQALQSTLYGVTPSDPMTLAAVTALLLACSALACYLPARRAAAVNPMVALRAE
jgi:predicted permease